MAMAMYLVLVDAAIHASWSRFLPVRRCNDGEPLTATHDDPLSPACARCQEIRGQEW